MINNNQYIKVTTLSHMIVQHHAKVLIRLGTYLFMENLLLDLCLSTPTSYKPKSSGKYCCSNIESIQFRFFHYPRLIKMLKNWERFKELVLKKDLFLALKTAPNWSLASYNTENVFSSNPASPWPEETINTPYFCTTVMYSSLCCSLSSCITMVQSVWLHNSMYVIMSPSILLVQWCVVCELRKETCGP